MTKSERIRKHYEDGFLSVNEIAKLVGCRPEYVRVAARQRANGILGPADKAYKAANKEEILRKQRERYRRDPEKVLTYQRQRRARLLEAAE